MSLLKKIGMVLVAGALSAGVMYSGFAQETPKVNPLETPKPAEESDIEKEARRYGGLFVGLSGEQAVLAWDRDNDGDFDLDCYYEVADSYSESEFLLKLNKAYEKDNSGKKELVGNDEYKKFFFRAVKTLGFDYIELGRDENRDGNEDRRYVYGVMEKAKEEDISGIGAKLLLIIKDNNNDGKFDSDETLWRVDGKPAPTQEPKALDPEKFI